MRILIVSPWLPQREALHAGSKSLFHELEWLAQRHEVHIVCYGHGESQEEVNSIRACCQTMTVINPAYTARQKLGRFLHGGWRQPWTLGRNTILTMQTTIREVCSQHRIDAVYLMWTEMGRYLDAIPPGIRRLLVMQDLESLVRPREVPLYLWGRARLMAQRRARRLIDIERKSISRVDMIVSRSRHDQTRLRDTGFESVLVVPVYYDAELLRDIQPETRVEGQLTFFGALDRVANTAAVQFLACEVWPQIRDICPQARLVIAGANPPSSLVQLSVTDPRITVTGYVPDIRQLWAATDVAVLPSVIGGGMLVKVAQAMAAGRPVVTTPMGNEGIGAPPEAILIADNPADFAAGIVGLLQDRTRLTHVAQAGQNYVRETLDWEASMRILESTILDSSAPAKIP